MKTIIALLSAIVFSTGTSFATGNPDLVHEIKSKIFVDLSTIDINESGQDYVTVSFRIVDAEIKIMEIGSSNRELEKIIIRELNDIHVDSPYISGRTYVYRFTFEKI